MRSIAQTIAKGLVIYIGIVAMLLCTQEILDWWYLVGEPEPFDVAIKTYDLTTADSMYIFPCGDCSDPYSYFPPNPHVPPGAHMYNIVAYTVDGVTWLWCPELSEWVNITGVCEGLGGGVVVPE